LSALTLLRALSPVEHRHLRCKNKKMLHATPYLLSNKLIPPYGGEYICYGTQLVASLRMFYVLEATVVART
jgi:hypothetical protein